jgi:Ca2+-binding EF-hand superfamily protein
MNRYWLHCVVAAGLFLTVGFATADPPAAVDDRHDLIFLAEARPILIRMHVQLDGKPVQAAWDDFLQHLFSHLDVNGDGLLSKEEAERAPPVDQILSGGLGRAFGGMGKAPAAPALADMDTDKNGQVSLAELAAYYRKSGFNPVQVQPEGGGANPFGAGAVLGGRRSEPKVEAVAEAIFALLDTNKDGKLSRKELAAAPAVLLRRDEDDDEMVTPTEVTPNTNQATNVVASMMAMGVAGKAGPAAGPKNVILLPAPGEPTTDLERRFQQAYGKSSDDSDERRLTREQLGLDETTFKQLDTNGDGMLDAAELAGFVKRAPDFELIVRVGRKDFGDPHVAVSAGNAQITSGLARIDLGRTRVDLRVNNAYSSDQIAGILRQQFLAQFKQADKANVGYLDEKAVKANRTFSSLFRAMDRDGDGKLYESEVIAYLDQLAELQNRARAACVTLALTNTSRGMFDLLDTNRDGRLGVREMRGAVKLLDTLDAGHKGYLERADLPRSYQLALRRGPASAGGAGGAIFDLYRGPERSDAIGEPTAGPTWFRKMDRNRDGDVSRREFLGTDEQFRQIDADGDGLISAGEADRFDARLRK